MSSVKLGPHINPTKALSSNRSRLYWAIARILIGITSTCFFIYFLYLECRTAYQVHLLSLTVSTNAQLIDWLRLSGMQTEYLWYVSRRTQPPPDPFAGNVVVTPSLYSRTSDASLAALQSLWGLTSKGGMLQGNDSKVMEVSIERIIKMNELDLEMSGFEWEWYFEVMDFWHNVRFFICGVVSRNISFQRQEIAVYNIALVALLYEREYLACYRDVMLQYYTNPNDTTREQVAEYNRATTIYEREVEQKMPLSLMPIYLSSRSEPIWQNCNTVIQLYTDSYHSEQFMNTTFNVTEWYSCAWVLLHAQRRIRDVLSEHMKGEMDNYLNEVVSYVIIAAVGILLELLAAGTLIHQALPVLILYITFKPSAGATSRMTISGRGGSKT